MRARIKLTRMHQINGPDYWQANCYMLDHTFQSTGLTQQKALDKMFANIDTVVSREWNMAHMINNRINFLRQCRLEKQAKMAEQATIPDPVKKKGLFSRIVRYVYN